MKKLCVVVLVGLLGVVSAYADSQDNAVFRTRMLPDNEVPPVPGAGNSANATITVRVTRDGRGNVDAATVTFDIDYTVAAATIFTGLHIHNAPSGQNGSVVIDTGITAAAPLNVTAGSGKITRIVNYASTDANGIRFVTGLLATPENYYVNIHSTTNPGGLMRGQILGNRLVFRPVMSPIFENPPINIDAEGAALVEVQVNRDPQTGAITSGTVVFDVDYRFPAPVTITGLHIHSAAIGVNGPVVIDTGVNGTSAAITNATRGNIFRAVEINSTNTTAIAALNGLFNDPTQYYINLHTSVNTGGVIRGQLSKDVFAFFNLMTQAEENPPTNVPGTANSMTYVQVNRDSTGNITSGAVSFNINYSMGSPQTFTGLHIHNAKIGVNGPVVINTGISGGSPVVTNAEGSGSINREVTIGPTDAPLEFMRGLLENPENYYVNIHTTQFGGGVVRAQLAKETYHYKTTMSPANEVPPITGVDTAATGWVTAKVNRDTNGVLTGGTVTFDVNFTNTGPITFTGLHIHHPAVAGVNAPVTINTGISGTLTVESTTGSGNITRVVTVDPANANAMAALQALITAPDTAYINLHTVQFGGGVVRSQMLPVVNPVAQAAGGAEWLTAVTIRNPSTTAAVHGIIDFFIFNGLPMPATVADPHMSFLIPAGGSTTISTHNKGGFLGGFAKVFSNGPVTVESRYAQTSFPPNSNTATTVTARSVTVPVTFGPAITNNTGIALIANSTGTLTLSLRDSSGAAIAGGSRSIDVTAGQYLSLFVSEWLPSVATPQYTGLLTFTISTGTVSALGLQFNGSIVPATVTVTAVE